MTECGGKTQYVSEDAAKRGAVGVARRNGDRRMKVYKCAACHKWHLSAQMSRTY